MSEIDRYALFSRGFYLVQRVLERAPMRGYTGIVVREGVLWFNPRLPDGLRFLSMTIRYRGHALDVLVKHDALEILARPSNAAAVKLGALEAVHTLAAGESHRFALGKR